MIVGLADKRAIDCRSTSMILRHGGARSRLMFSLLRSPCVNLQQLPPTRFRSSHLLKFIVVVVPSCDNCTGRDDGGCVSRNFQAWTTTMLTTARTMKDDNNY